MKSGVNGARYVETRSKLMSAYLPSPRGEGDPLAGDEVHLKVMPDHGRMLPFVSAGGAKPIAGAWGGLEGFTPPHL